MPITNDPTPKTNVKDGYYGNSIGNMNQDATIASHITFKK